MCGYKTLPCRKLLMLVALHVGLLCSGFPGTLQLGGSVLVQQYSGQLVLNCLRLSSRSGDEPVLMAVLSRLGCLPFQMWLDALA